jgi:alkylhydroperoxidase family enzyme
MSAMLSSSHASDETTFRLLAARASLLWWRAGRTAPSNRISMARLPYVEDPAAAGSGSPVAAAYAEIRALGRPLLNLYRVLANQPPALRAFLGMSRYIRDDSTLPPPLRELVILTTAFALGVRYEQVHHLAAARRAGVAEAKLDAFPAWQESQAFEPAERAAMAYADEAAGTRHVRDATFDALRAHFTASQIIDLALTVGWYHLCGALLVPLEVDVER